MKKRKKHKKGNWSKVETNIVLAEIETHQKRLRAEYSKKFDEGVASISEILGRYSALDVAASIFVSSLWLPNIACLVKHEFLLAVFLSKTPDSFCTTQKITTYVDFSRFLEEIKPYLPTFHELEDYVPESDWGDVKFHHEGKNYRMFYGSDLESPYDFLTEFQMTHCSLEEDFVRKSGRSPSRELSLTLKMQDDILSRITK